MKFRSAILAISMSGSMLPMLLNCKKEASVKAVSATGTITDWDGNVYHSVTIGTQVWLVENLKTTKYINGTNIPNGGSTSSTIGSYYNYGGIDYNSNYYGRLYNYAAAIKDICPKGWHVPTDSDWELLITYLGGANVAGGKLKESSAGSWEYPNTGATNETGFSALPAGSFSPEDRTLFMGVILYGLWWSSTPSGNGKAWARSMQYDDVNVLNNSLSFGSAVSIRCIKD